MAVVIFSSSWCVCVYVCLIVVGHLCVMVMVVGCCAGSSRVCVCMFLCLCVLVCMYGGEYVCVVGHMYVHRHVCV